MTLIGTTSKERRMGTKEEIYMEALLEVVKLKLDDYHTVFLANMVLRKMRHPEEKIPEIAFRVMKKMPRIYKKKKNILELSPEKSLDKLEEKLEECKNIPESLYNGKTVSNVVRYLCCKVLFRLEEKED